MSRRPDHAQEVELARGVLRAEAASVGALAGRLGVSFGLAVDVLDRAAAGHGSVLVSGLGKSGLIGQKISATLASLAVPSHFVHPAEAAHGDLGRIRSADCLLLLSNSGETDEVVNLALLCKPEGVPIVAITGDDHAAPRSTLARLATVTLALGPLTEAAEAVPGAALAPTCSTTAALAMGDALALALAHRRAFTADDFARRHPGGNLGGLLRPITEVLRFTVGKNLPLTPAGVTVRQALADADRLGRRPGALLITHSDGTLAGIFTDGDLRRLVLGRPDGLDRPIDDVMTRSPRSLPDSAFVRDAVRMVREFRADEIPVVDARGRPVGLLDVQDLIALRLVHDESTPR
ncbi:MAG: KpsF/GutQ family sugar-phosphate isomerase [Phycisphaerales bacterium]|nr:KpsF/GutQ family sugar-phosphate isomerase [Phycisphaerales bacterium]